MFHATQLVSGFLRLTRSKTSGSAHELSTVATHFPAYTGLLLEISQNIPSLKTSRKHKGEDGRIGVLGGSREYAGAPYYAGISALKCGADLCTIITTPEASTPIKSYSPELIVVPYITESDERSVKECVAMLPRLHTLVIGPGLGRDQRILGVTERVISEAKERGLPIVIDADGLFLIAQKPAIIKGYRKAILTPNAVEFERLYNSVVKKESQGDNNELIDVKTLAKMLNVTVLYKGFTDIITDGENVLLVSTESSSRRCGGQGDVLSGTVAVFLHWLSQYYNKNSTRNEKSQLNQYGPMMLSCYAASVLTRQCNLEAVKKHGRSTLAPDLITEIEPVFRKLFPSSE